jgi:hypothetical protein
LKDAFGRERLLSYLHPDDFEKLRGSISTTDGGVALGNEIQRIRIVFKYAYDAGLNQTPMSYGPGFKRPTKKYLRKVRNEKAESMFEADEIRRLLVPATPALKAMILLGINAAFGNTDCARLPPAPLLGAAGVLPPGPRRRPSRQRTIRQGMQESRQASLAHLDRVPDEGANRG